jgi:Uma2 family endonuclease
VVEVVSTNWETDDARKVEEYAILGIPEYWIVDYRGLGAWLLSVNQNNLLSPFAN